MLSLNLCVYHEPYKVINCDDLNGIQYVFKFDNGYGASVIKHDYSYGHEKDLWELGVLYFDDDLEAHLCYDTDVTNDVIGGLTDEDVEDYLNQIAKLGEKHEQND